MTGPVAPALPEAGGRASRGGWERPVLAVLTLLLLSFGLVNLYSASAPLAQRQGLPDTFYLLRQAVGALAGLVVLVVCARIPYRIWRRYAWPLVFASSAVLVILLLPFARAIAPEINGARRWLELPGFRFQPSELAKLAIVVWTAHMAVVRQHRFRSLSRGMLPFLLVWAVLLVPVVLEPDLSTAFVIGTGAAITLFVGGARIGHFAFFGVLLAPVGALLLGTATRRERILAFRDLATHAEGAGYQVHQSLIALGSGGIAGRGFGEGRQKFGFVPEPHNDFIFSMIGEEWGLLGVGILLGLYADDHLHRVPDRGRSHRPVRPAPRHRHHEHACPPRLPPHGRRPGARPSHGARASARLLRALEPPRHDGGDRHPPRGGPGSSGGRDAGDVTLPPVVVFSGGGTGGHLYPALALAAALEERRPDVVSLFVGAERGIEARILPERGLRHLLVRVEGLRRGPFLPNLGVLALMARATLQVAEAFRRVRPQLAVVTGGYAGGPAGLAAILTRTRLVLQEQNSLPGVTTRVLAPHAREIHLAFPEALRALPRRARRRAAFSGNPIRPPVRPPRREAAAALGVDPASRIVLVTGGSQGSRALNRIVLEAVRGVQEGGLERPGGLELFWVTGPAELPEVEAGLEASGSPPGCGRWATPTRCRWPSRSPRWR